MPDYEYEASLDIGDIKKRLEQAAKEFDQFAKKAEDGLDKVQREADQAAKKVKETGDAAGKAGDKFKGFVGKLSGITAVIGSLGAAVAIGKQLVDVAIENEKAQFDLASAAAAANREFGDGVGTMESWQKTVKDLSAETKVFSEREVANASARLVDMTKRLGLSEQEMQTVLKRTADLSAGKVDLEGGIERVTAALRGEAESAEFLGLSLSETAIKQYAEAHGLVFKELTDGEKVQLRYQLLLDQTNQVQGRAAAFAETMAGRQAAVNAQIENSNALLGQQLFPLYEGWARLIEIVAGETHENVGFITVTLAGLRATLLTVGAGFVTLATSGKAAFDILTAGTKALLSLKNPIAATFQAVKDNSDELLAFGEFNKNIFKTFQDGFGQLIDDWEKQEGAAQKAAAGIGPSAGSIQSGIEGIVAAQEEAIPTAEEYAEAQAKIQEAHDKLDTDAARDELDALIAAERKAADAAVDAAREREKIALKNQQAIEDIAQKSEQAFADAGIDAGRDEEDAARESGRTQADITRSLAQKTVDIARQAAQKKVDIETAYRRKIQEIAQKFSIAALDAERSRDAVAFLAAKRERDLAFAGAATERDQGIQDVNTEAGRAQGAAQTDAQREREQAKIEQERAAEDRAIENERKLADLQTQLERELEAQVQANERDLEAQRVKEEQAAVDRATALEREAADRATANERKLADLEKSLGEEKALVAQYEAQKTAVFTGESQKRIAQAQKEAAEMKRLQAQSAAGAGRGGNPLTGGPIRRFASGGNFGAGEPIIVGERGPEMVQFPQAGNVIPNNRLPSRVPAPAGATFNRTTIDNSQTNNLDLIDPTKLSATQRAILRNEVATAMAEDRARSRRAGVR
jgi:hypothetical protein